MSRKTTIARRASIANTTLQDAWDELRAIIDGLPLAVMGVLTVGSRGRAGHFAPKSWRARNPNGAHEIAVNPSLFTNPKELLETLVHEAAHAALFEEDPDRTEHDAGCSLNDPHYHTTVFRDKCIEVGLDCQMLNKRYGFTLTSWPSTGVPERYHGVLALLRDGMPLGARRAPKRPMPNWNPLVKLECKCDPRRIIYLPRNGAHASAIRCEKCSGLFELPLMH